MIDNQTNALNTIEKTILNIKLNTSKLCEDFKYCNVYISDIHLLNNGKTPNLDMYVLRRASCALDEIYKEEEELSKHHRIQTIYHKIG